LQDQATKRVNEILAEFSSKQEPFSRFTSEIEILLKRLLLRSGKVHKVESRTKEKKSLEKKLFRPDKHYSKLDDVTDICGVRVITYFADDVPKVFKIIDRELKVLESNDKADLLHPDQFGYLSFHCIATLSKRRARLTENRDFIGLKAEIQIRSILQHAWAEIEHDLGYKNPHSVPKKIRRPFSRLAGLLELGDSEFKRIRGEAKAHVREIERGIFHSPTDLAIDKDSLAAYIKQSPLISRIEAPVLNAIHLRNVSSDAFVEAYVDRLGFLGVKTIGEVEKLLFKRKEFITKYLIAWFRGKGNGRLHFFPQGISISFLGWAMVLEKGGLPALTDFLTKHAFNKNQDVQKLAGEMEFEYKKAKRTSIPR
jgi:ppGpp synthetase/RelA/SpoT-type nucleotidyltranferase